MGATRRRSKTVSVSRCRKSVKAGATNQQERRILPGPCYLTLAEPAEMLLQAAAELSPHASMRRTYGVLSRLRLYLESLEAKQVLCQLRATGNLRAAT